MLFRMPNDVHPKQVRPGPTGDMITPAAERRNLAATVAGQLRVGSEQCLELSNVSMLDGREKPGCEEPPCRAA
jgi:hypothetical protein